MSATGPLDAGEVFTDLSPLMRDYLESAKKLSTQYKHFFLGQEHFFAAFLLNGYSAIRKYINQPKWNAKKKINPLLQKAYPQAKGKVKWKDACPSGFCVTPRMQDSWDEAIHLTQFGEPTDVRDIHVLNAIFEGINKPIREWLKSENFDEKDIISFLKDELENKGSSNSEDRAKSDHGGGAVGGISGFFSSLFGGNKKHKDKPVEKHEPSAQHVDSNNNINEQQSHKQYDEPVPIEELPKQETSKEVEEQVIEEPKVEIKDVIKEEPKINRSRVLRVGDSYTYQEEELVSRGMPDEIIDEFMRLADEYGPLPDRIFFNNKKVYFENLLYENLTIEDYKVVVSDLEERIKAAVARSPFRSSSHVAPTHSLFNRKTPEQVEEETQGEEVIPAFTPEAEQVGTSQSVDEGSVPAFTPEAEQVETSQSVDEGSVPAFSPETNQMDAQPVDEGYYAPAFTHETNQMDAQPVDEGYAPVFTPETNQMNAQPVDEGYAPVFTPETNQMDAQPVDEGYYAPAFTPETNQMDAQPVDENIIVENSSNESEVVTEDIQNKENQQEIAGSYYDKTEKSDIVSYEKSIIEDNLEIALEDSSKVKYIKGCSPLAIYRKYKKYINISELLKDSKSLYLTKNIDNLQEGFHWSEMLNFVPVNSVSPTPKVGKIDLDMITVGVFEKTN